MKVLWILNGCGLEGGSITGGPVRFHEISRRWLAKGVEQHLMTTSGGETMLRGMGCELPMTHVPASLLLRKEPVRAFRLWSYLVSAACAPGRLRKLVRSKGERPDVVFTASDYFCDIVPALVAKRTLGCRWIAWIHHRELPPSQRPGNRWVNTLTHRMQERSLRRIAAFADAAWTYDTDAGDLVRERLLAFGMPENRIRRMRCGVNVEDIHGVPEPLAKSVDATMIGVRPNKGLHDILPVWERVLAKRPGTTLRLMGGMSGEAETLDEIRRRGLEKTITVFRPEGGFLPAAEYYAKIKESRILFAPSHEEGWGIAVCEAMAAGVPVVAYALPVYRRIYGDSFRSVSCFDMNAFADAIVDTLDSPMRWNDYRQRGLSCADTFGWDRIAEEDGTEMQAVCALQTP